jgi:hypothetical protein
MYAQCGLTIALIFFGIYISMWILELIRMRIIFINRESIANWKPLVNQYKIFGQPKEDSVGIISLVTVCMGMTSLLFMWPLTVIAILWFTIILILRQRKDNE